MAGKVEIWNMALGRIANTRRVEDPEEDTRQGKLCRIFWEQTRDYVLADFPWPAGRSFPVLNLVEEDPTPEWAYSYAYPVACLHFVRILSGDRNDSRQSQVPYRIASDGAGGALILTDQEDAQAEVIVRRDDPGKYPPDLVSTIAWRLAGELAPGLGGELGSKWRLDAFKMYDVERSIAEARHANEERAEEPPVSEFERAR